MGSRTPTQIRVGVDQNQGREGQIEVGVRREDMSCRHIYSHRGGSVVMVCLVRSWEYLSGDYIVRTVVLGHCNLS